MSTIPRLREVFSIEDCTADRFDEEYLRVIKGQKIDSGYFYYNDGPVYRYLLISEGEPLSAAWDDGTDGASTSLYDFFSPFIRNPQKLSFCLADKSLVEGLAVSWQQRPDAHTSPGLIDAAEMIKSLLRRNREFIVRLRRDAHTSFLLMGASKINSYYFGLHKFLEGDAETKLVHELTANHAFLSIDVFESQDVMKAEDWAIVPNDFAEGMVKFYCCSSPHLILYLGEREIKRIPLRNEPVIIGRDPNTDLFVDNLSISRNHARVVYKHGACSIEDLGSKNGTFIDNSRIEGPTMLNDGQQITIGKHTIKYLQRAMIHEKTIDADLLDKTIVMRPGATATLSKDEKNLAASITYNNHNYTISSSPFAIGSASGSNLSVNSPSVKPNHAILQKDSSNQWWIVHKGGLFSSTRINGRKINTSPLRSGDLIQLGTIMLRFQLSEE
jgi:pSer/pThr/pTyr-binding forkhead associated (FHA) protein